MECFWIEFLLNLLCFDCGFCGFYCVEVGLFDDGYYVEFGGVGCVC